MRGTREITILAVCLSSLFLKSSVQSMSPDEEIVRNSYAKFSFLCAVEAVSDLAQAQELGKPVDQYDLASRLDKAVPTFTLTDFETGAVASIADRPWGDFVTPESSVTLILGSGSSSRYYMDNGVQSLWRGEHVFWTQARKSDAAAETEMMARPVSKAIEIGSPFWSGKENPVKYTSYVSFTVDASLNGKSTGPHKAIYLFGTDSHGKEFVAENDLISGASAGMWRILSTPTYPEGFLQSRLRNTSVVTTWIRDNEMPAASCDPTKRDVCCSHGRCGFSQTDLNRDLAAPLPAIGGNQ